MNVPVSANAKERRVWESVSDPKEGGSKLTKIPSELNEQKMNVPVHSKPTNVKRINYICRRSEVSRELFGCGSSCR